VAMRDLTRLGCAFVPSNHHHAWHTPSPKSG
jgi:hypothetical protein